jgi:hypothetical protein
VCTGTGPLMIKRRTSSVTSARVAAMPQTNTDQPSLSDVDLASSVSDLSDMNNLPEQHTAEACCVSALR